MTRLTVILFGLLALSAAVAGAAEDKPAARPGIEIAVAPFLSVRTLLEHY